MNNDLNLGKLSFYWRMTEKPNVPPNPVPDFVDFSFTFWEDYQLLIQKRNPKTWEYLETIYRENYNVGYLQEGHALALSYGGDFLEFIEYAIKKYNPSINRISEIGAGGCYILKNLKDKGYTVAAIDPSPATEVKGKEYDIEVISDFYPASRSIPKSDLIIHYDVLEHVPDPAEFIRFHSKDLNAGGLILFAVPDCTAYIEKGDISMILHEHLNYYNALSLNNVVQAGGFTPLEIKPARYGGVLYCVAQVATYPNDWNPKKGKEIFNGFKEKTEKLMAQIKAFISEGTAEKNTLGCYIPLRALPYLSDIETSENIRFFDDNPGIYRQYFDGFAIPVENFEDLCRKPVTHLLILSFAFGDVIKEKVLKALPGSSIEIKSFNDFKS